MTFKFVNILFCFNSLTAINIEIWIIILSLIGITLNIIGLFYIPWKVTSLTMKILFIIGLVFIGLSFLISLIIFLLRKNHKLRKPAKRIFILSLISIIFICFFSLVIFIAVLFGTISDLDNKIIKTTEEINEETGEVLNTFKTEERLCTKTKKVISILIVFLLFAIWLLLSFFWASEYIRVANNIEGSYAEFIKNEKEKISKNPSENGFNLVGHDKYGFPIYGQQIGNKIKIKDVEKNFYEKSERNINFSNKYFDEKGKINIKYYTKKCHNSLSQKEIDEKFKEKEKYLEKYYDGENMFQNYDNFQNKTFLNFEDKNNSINVGYVI